jgi:hypothetical protein
MTDDTVSLADIEGVPVHAGRERIGTVSGVFFDLGLARVVGLEVAAADGQSAFVPWVATSRQGRAVRIESRLVLVGGAPVDYYARHGVCLSGVGLAGLIATQTGEIECPTDSGDGVLAAA